MKFGTSLIAVASLAAQTSAQIVNNPVKNYIVVETANFTCTQAGSRCAFLRQDFSMEPDAPFGRIQDTLDNSIFTANDVTDSMTLNGCSSGRCLVLCTDACACVLADGSPCELTTSKPAPAPVTVAPSPAPEAYTCAKRTDTSLCAKLFPVVPVGTPKCDCYNFCKGVFTSCCDRSGQCGYLTCDGTTGDPGTMGSYVWGCTVADLPAGSPLPGAAKTNTSSPNGSSGANIPRALGLVLSLIVAVVAL
jgi:hypothetical protein